MPLRATGRRSNAFAGLRTLRADPWTAPERTAFPLLGPDFPLRKDDSGRAPNGWRQAPDPLALLFAVVDAQDRVGGIAAFAPLPRHPGTTPSTGYEDVKLVAVSRLVADNINHVQIDWIQYGPKLAQVALTFGADDLDDVSASDHAPAGRRRAPLAEIERNVQAAGFTPVERDGRFNPL